MDKICKTCAEEKPFVEFRSRKKSNGRIYYESDCRPCERVKNKIRCKKRYKEKIEWYREYTKNNKAKLDAYNKRYGEENRERLKEYRQKRRKQDNENQKAWAKRKRLEKPSTKMRAYVSNQIGRALKKNGASKSGQSCLKYLPYTFEELRAHIEAQFELWMSWKNHGRYNTKTWDDRDPSTWTWQLDHIIPQSCTPYESMNDDNFQKCWNLANLRPLSAKKNVLDGTSLIRHKQAF